MNTSSRRATTLVTIRFSVILLVLASLFALDAHAQIFDTTGRWKRVDPSIDPPFASRDERGTSFFFRDTLVGFRSANYPGRGPRQYKTTDGGYTWTLLASPIPVPHTLLDSGFAYGPASRTISTDGGTTWSELKVTAIDTTTVMQPSWGYIAGSRTYHAFLQGGAFSSRLAFSTNGGTTWHWGDSVVDVGANDSLRVNTLFGPLPYPSWMTAPTVAWSDLMHFRGPVLTVRTTAEQRIDDTIRRRHYIGRLNVAEKSASWSEVPFVNESSRLWETWFISATEGYVTTYYGPNSSLGLWRTSDGGRTWDSLGTIPSTAGLRSLRFFTPLRGIMNTLHTEDGGKTWYQRQGNPFGATSYAISPDHLIAHGDSSLLAHSTDQGKTWTRSPVVAPIRSLAAHGGRVLLGREMRSVMVSHDSGMTWHDVGAVAGLPDSVRAVWALGFPDTAFTPDRVLGVASVGGVATLTTPAPRVYLIESTDGGLNWKIGARLPELDTMVKTGTEISTLLDLPWMMEFAPGTGGMEGVMMIAGLHGILASTDDGATWNIRYNELPIHAIEMVEPSRGVAVVSDWGSLSSAIYATTDGGHTWARTYNVPDGHVRPFGLQAIDPTTYRALFVGHELYNNWVVVESTDGGASWHEATLPGSGAPSPLRGELYWIDRQRAYMIGEGASIMYSTNGGFTFSPLRSLDSELRVGDGLRPYRPLMTANDGRYLWMATRNGAVARWRLGTEVASGVEERDMHDGEMRLVESPARGDEAIVELRAGTEKGVDLVLYDILGRPVRALRANAGTERVRIDIAGLPSGRYVVQARTGSGVQSLPLIVVD